MPFPRYQSTTSDSFGAPGVYVKELAVSAPVRGLFRGTVGFVGRCIRGPVGKLIYCPTYNRFLDVFGGRDFGINGGAANGHVWWALQQKRWGKFYVVRVAAAADVAASFTLETAAGGLGTAIATISAYAVGLHGNDIMWKVTAASDGNANHWNLQIQLYGKAYLFENLDTSATGNDNTSIVVGTDDATIIRITKIADGRPVNSAATVDGADANGFTKLGQTVANFTSVAGTGGAAADTDYTGAGKGMEIMHAARGVDVKVVAGRSNTAIKTKIFNLSPTCNASFWAISPDSETVTSATWITEVASYRNRKIFPCFNSPYYIDPVTGAEAVGEPHIHLASILSQTEPDVHPGVIDTAELNQGITRLYNELQDGDRDALDAAGTSYMNRDIDDNNNNVFLFGNGRTADLTVNNSQIDGERSKVYLIQGLSQRMRGDQNKPNTPIARAKRAGAFTGWLTELAEAQRFVQTDATTKLPQFEIKNGDEVNTDTDTAAGIQRDLVLIRLIPKNLYMQLQVEAGTDVEITEQT